MEYARTDQEVSDLMEENARLYEALEAADYYIDRLQKAWLGTRVTDMGEAANRYCLIGLPLLEAHRGDN